MFDPDRDTPAKPGSMPVSQRLDPERHKRADEPVLQRHATLMQCLRDEGDLQAEERAQMAIDEDYDDHLHWREEDAMALIERGQAPLVFNEGRQTREWVTGMQKRMRMDYKILPRESNDEAGAQAKTKVFKYISDVNLSQWHESRAFKQAVVSGLGWLEEGINTDPGAEQIYSGSEDWRNVMRDSRSRDFDLKDARYLFRKRRTDLDYACALLPHAKEHLRQQATLEVDGDDRGDNVWYLGERLTGSTEIMSVYDRLPGTSRSRSAYIGGSIAADSGRRLALDLLECWYRVPEAVQVFGAGPLKGKVFDPNNPGHQQIERDRWRLFAAVSNRMRVMVATEAAPTWDGASPFRHGNFLLVPVWGYRRGRDGQCYGIWRGMRDINDDINKRASKALYAASSNRVISRKGNVDDPELARQEAARPNMWLEVKDIGQTRFEKPTADMQMNMEMLGFNREMLRNIGGVTDANLGRNSRAVSGKAIGLQQDQGSLTTSELPDNLRLAKQMAGRLRLSHIEQFMTEQQVIRIIGEGRPVEWMTINQPQPDGSVLNDITSKEADFIISERDYRESYAQAAIEGMMELLGKIGTFAPQVVMTVLDLVVESAEIHNKEEWVARIRALNGQRDPNKAPTPEEMQQQQQRQAEEAEMKAMEKATIQAQLDKLQAEVKKLDTAALTDRVNSIFSALQAAQVVALTPGVAPVADTIAQGAGFKDQAGDDPNIPAIGGQAGPAMPGAMPMAGPGMAPPDQANPMPAPPLQAMPQPPQGLAGARGGIQTPRASDNGPAM
jgi:hypothetical protein